MKTIAVVDDDAAFRETLRDALSAQGYGVVCAADATEFIALAQKSWLDLVVLDMQMPGGGGPAALRFLDSRKDTNAIPILFLSSMPGDKVREWYKGTARTGYLQKPPDLRRLIDNVKGLLGP